MEEKIPLLESFSKADRQRLSEKWASVARDMSIIEAFLVELKKDIEPAELSEFEAVVAEAAEKYYGFESGFDLPEPEVEYITKEAKAELESIAGVGETVALALSLIKSKMERLGYDFNVQDDSMDEPRVGSEMVPGVDLGSLYAEVNIDALKKMEASGETVFKDSREVMADIKQILQLRGFTIDEREKALFHKIKNSLSDIVDIERLLRAHDLTPESENEYQSRIDNERKYILEEVAAFLQTEKRDEELKEDSDDLPEKGTQDFESEKAANLEAYVLYEALPADSPLRDTWEFKQAANGAAALRDFKVRPDDVKTSEMIQAKVGDIFAKQMDTLRKKAEEFGGIVALTESAITTTPEPVVTTSVDTDPVVDKAPLTLDEKIKAAVAEGTEFYQSLPTEFLNQSLSIPALDTAVAGLGEAEAEPNQVTKAVLVGTFISAIAEARAEYAEWQRRPAASTPSAFDGSKAVDLPEPINPYDMSLLDGEGKPSSTPEPVVVTEPKSVEASTPAKVEVSPAESYHLLRTESLEAKKAYQAKETEFNALLKAEYADDSFLSRLRSSKKVLGINQELPPALEALRKEYREARALYAESLNAALVAREAIQKPKNSPEKEYSSESDTTRLAFAQKFILKPQEVQLAMQERTILSEKLRALKDRVIGDLGKHKWLIRGGVIVGAGIAGGLSGGVGLALAGASWQGVKIAASAFAGAGAAKAMHDVYQVDVNKADQEVAGVKSGIKESAFSISDLVAAGTDGDMAQKLDAVGGLYGSSLLAQEKAINKQRVASIGAAVVVGGATGIGSTLFTPEVMAGAAAVSGGTTEPAVPTGATAAVEAPTPTGATSSITEMVLEKMKGPVLIEKISLPQYAPEGDVTKTVIISDISFGPKADLSALSEAEKANFFKEVRVLSDDIIAGDIDVNERVFETRLQEKIEAKFGKADWWDKANLTKVDGKLESVPTGAAAGETVAAAGATEAAPAETGPAPEAAIKEQVVVKGDTVGEILLKRFGTKFDGMSDVQRGQVLDRLFNRLDQSPETIKALGLRSDSVDLIYPDEKLNLTVLERELDAELKAGVTSEPAAAKTGALKVGADMDTKSVPIVVKETYTPEGYKIETNLSDRVYNEAPVSVDPIPPYEVPARPAAPLASVRPEPLSFPKVIPLNGQYMEHPDYIKLRTEVFGTTGKGYDMALKDAVALVDRNTYDFTDGLFGSRYESPFNLLRDKSLEDFEKFQAQPNQDLRYYLQQNNIKYETYLQWVDLVDDMKKELPYQATTKVGDMFERLVLDEAVAKHNINLKVKST